jgi:hypothetical protein
VIPAAGDRGTYLKTGLVRIKSLPHRKSRPLKLMALNLETVLQVSVSDPRYLDQRSCRFQWLSLPEENSVDTGEGKDESSGASGGMCLYHCSVGVSLTYTSYEERLEGHRSWGYRHCLRRRTGGLSRICSSQSRPERHLRHLSELRSSLQPFTPNPVLTNPSAGSSRRQGKDPTPLLTHICTGASFRSTYQ